MLTALATHPQDVSGNAAKSGIAKGDTIIYTSSFFGDELWPADKPGFSKSAINACPSPVCFVYVSATCSPPNMGWLPHRMPVSLASSSLLAPEDPHNVQAVSSDVSVTAALTSPVPDMPPVKWTHGRCWVDNNPACRAGGELDPCLALHNLGNTGGGRQRGRDREAAAQRHVSSTPYAISL